MSEVYLVFFILQTTIGGVLTVMYAKHENTRFPPAHVKSKISLNLFVMLQCSIYLKILYTPRGVCDIKRQGGVFPRNNFTLSRNAETWIFLVWIIMYDKIGGVPNTVWGVGVVIY